MLCVGYVLEKLLDVIATIDNVLMSDRYTHVRTRVCVIPVSYFEETICVSLYRMHWSCPETQPVHVLYAQYFLQML